MKEKSFSKGEFLVREGETDSSFYIVKSGIWRGYYMRDGKEDCSLWFVSEGDSLFSIWCYADGKPSAINIEAMSDSVVYCIGKEALEGFFASSGSRERCGRLVFERHILDFETWMIHSGDPRGKERYKALLKANPGLLQHVPLKYIASYLWITPQSLSRIRAEIAREERENQ